MRRALLAVLLFCSPALADRAAVEAVLRQMEQAVLAADAPAYMKLIDPAEPTFVKEQENLVKDLAKNKAVSFTITIVDDPSKPDAAVTAEKPAEPKKDDTKGGGTASGGKDDEDIPAARPTRFGETNADCRVKMTWKMEGASRERTLTMPVSFVKRGERWLYAGEQWDVVEKAPDEKPGFRGVRVLYEPGNQRLRRVAGVVVKVMPEVRSTVDHHFRLSVPGVQVVKLYQSMRHLQASIWLSYTDALSGWNEPNESIKILPSGRANDDGMKTLLAHEYGHVATFHLGAKATDAPWWSLEGAAEMSASLFRKNPAERRNRTVRRWLKDGELAEWKDISPFPLASKDLYNQVYTQGEHMLAYLTTRFGDEGRIAFLKELCTGKSMEEASRVALGLEWSDVSAAWRASIELPGGGGKGDEDKQP